MQLPVKSTSKKDNPKSDSSNVLRTPLSDPRIRPPGDSGRSETDFTIHHILVETGEDMIEKVKAFALNLPRNRNVCIMSARGQVSDAILFAPVSGTTVTYKGKYEIISIRGMIWHSQSNFDSCTMSHFIAYALASEDGIIRGDGPVKLIAFSTIEVVLGSFISQPGVLEEGRSEVEPGKDIVAKVLPIDGSNVVTSSNMIRNLEKQNQHIAMPSIDPVRQSLVNNDPKRKKTRIRGKNKTPTTQKQLDVLEEGRSGVGFDSFEPHIILVEPGQDIIKMVKEFVLEVHKSVSVISAHGLVSYVTFLADDIRTFEGLFQIISIRGTLLHSQCNSSPIMVSLVGSTGHVVGGRAINLIATKPIHVFLGSFICPEPAHFSYELATFPKEMD